MEIEPAPTAVERRQGYCLRPFKGNKQLNMELISVFIRENLVPFKVHIFWEGYKYMNFNKQFFLKVVVQ